MGIDRRGCEDVYAGWIEDHAEQMVEKGKKNAKEIFKDYKLVHGEQVDDADIDDTGAVGADSKHKSRN